MSITFPSSPSINDTYVVGSIIYLWDGAKWTVGGNTLIDRIIEDSNILEIENNNLLWTGGNVGIGTTNPTTTLEVTTSVDGEATLATFKNTSAGGTNETVDIKLGLENLTASNVILRAGKEANHGSSAATDNFFAIHTTLDSVSSEKLRITSSGNIGIGTDNPSQKFVVYNGNIKLQGEPTNIANLIFTRTDRSWSINNETDFRIYTSSGTTDSPSLLTFTINGGGNVGIGDTNPDQKLVVAGNIRTTGSLYGPSNFIIDPSTVGDDTGTVEIKGNLVVQGTTTTINSTTVDLDHISLGDNEIANFGNSNDLQIYHDGSNSFMLNSTGELQISSGGSTLFIQAVTNENAIKIVPNAAVELYYNGSQKFQTTSDGVRIGSASAPIDINAYETLNNGTLSFEGSAGQLFSITNSLTSGSIFSVNDVSGIPSIDVDADGTITLAEFGGNTGVGTSNPQYKLEVNGSFAATTKSFIIDHPTKEGMKLRYGSLEGPENGVYVRGKTTEFVIELPDYWTGLVDADTISVNLTPIGKSQTLWIKSIEDNKVIVGSKCTSVEYFYTIYGERKDVEKLEVEIGA